MSNTLFLNIDGVLADFSKQLSVKTGYALADVNQFLQRGVFDLDEKELSRQECRLKEKIQTVVLEKDFYASLPVKEGAPALLADLKKRFDRVYLFSRVLTTHIWDGRLNEACALKKQWVSEKLDSTFPKEQILITYMPAEKLMMSQPHCVLIDSVRKNVNKWVWHYMRNANVFSGGASGFVFVNAQQLTVDLEAKGFAVKTAEQAYPNFTFLCPQKVRD